MQAITGFLVLEKSKCGGDFHIGHIVSNEGKRYRIPRARQPVVDLCDNKVGHAVKIEGNVKPSGIQHQDTIYVGQVRLKKAN